MKQATLDLPSIIKENTLDEMEYDRALYDEDCCDEDMEYYHYADNPEYEYNGYLGEDEDFSDCCFRSKSMHVTDYPQAIYI